MSLPGEGLEPTRVLPRRILSPLRLPIPPPRPQFLMEATSGFEPLNRGFADPCLNHLATSPFIDGAEDEIRTRDFLLGKEAFYR
jgi:hypothetical protein